MKLITVIVTAMIVTLFSSSALFANTQLQSTQKKLTAHVSSCAIAELYFKFNHHYDKTQSALYAMSGIIDVDTNMPLYPNQVSLPQGDSKIYRASFKEQGSLFGVSYVKNAANKVQAESICEVSTACECQGAYCLMHISTNGVGCSLMQDRTDIPVGTSDNPYVVAMK